VKRKLGAKAGRGGSSSEEGSELSSLRDQIKLRKKSTREEIRVRKPHLKSNHSNNRAELKRSSWRFARRHAQPLPEFSTHMTTTTTTTVKRGSKKIKKG
jgi:hypothetical protein